MKVLTSFKDYPESGSAVTIGFFDGVHTGHAALIERLKQAAARLGVPSVVVTFSNHPREGLKANYIPKLLTTCDERLRLLEQTGVDYCVMVPFDKELAEYSSRIFMRKYLSEALHARFLLVGHDHHFGCDREKGFPHYQAIGVEYGIEVEQMPAYVNEGLCVSSSLIRKSLEAGGVVAARRMLGYEYFIEGTIVSGHKVGRTMGFPTANIAINDVHKFIPGEGVYAVELQIEGDDQRRRGMLYIGGRPTFVTLEEVRSIELNVFDFDGDIYHEQVQVFFQEYIRAEIKFDTPEKLAKQLGQDRDTVKEYFSKR